MISAVGGAPVATGAGGAGWEAAAKRAIERGDMEAYHELMCAPLLVIQLDVHYLSSCVTLR